MLEGTVEPAGPMRDSGIRASAEGVKRAINRHRPGFTYRPRVIRVLSIASGVLLHGHVALVSFALWTFFVITCFFGRPCGENPFGFRCPNPQW